MVQIRRLSVHIVKTEFWDKETKMSKPIKYLWFNGQDPRKDKTIDWSKKNRKLFNFRFIPNGDLIEMVQDDQGLHKTKIFKDWLSSNATGPYKRCSDIFYFLGGTTYFGNDHPYTEGMQICQRPLNKLSDSCVGGSNWIER